MGKEKTERNFAKKLAPKNKMLMCELQGKI